MGQTRVSNLHDFCQPQPLLFAACDDSLTHPTAELDEGFIRGRDAGFSVDIIKDYVATLTDRSVQRRLRDPKRNRSFSKVALDNRDGEEFILCESDDLVFEFDCKATSGCGVHYWFVKQEHEHAVLGVCYTVQPAQVEATRQSAIHGRTRTREATHFVRPEPVLPGLTC